MTIKESIYNELPLPGNFISSPQNDFSIQIPDNWFSTKDPELATNNIWLVHVNYSAVITIRKIVQLKEFNNDLRSKLLQVAKSNLILHKRKHSQGFKIVTPISIYKNNGIIYSSFEFKYENEKYARVIICEFDGDLFEIFAYTSKTGIKEISLLELFSIQESVCLSLIKNSNSKNIIQ